MLVEKLFGNAGDLDRIDFRLKRSVSGEFVLSVLAVTNDEKQLSKTINLNTTDLKPALDRSTKCMNDIAGDLRPGLTISFENAALGLATGGITIRKAGGEEIPLPDTLKAALAGLKSKSAPKEHKCDCAACSCEGKSTEEIYQRVSKIAESVNVQMQDLFNIVSLLLSERD